MSRSFLGGVAAGYGIAIPVGAIAVLIVLTAARDSFRQGAAAAFGAASADLSYATLAVVVGTALAHPLHAIATPLHLAGGCLLALIAVRGLATAFRKQANASETAPRRPRGTYARFLGLSLVNPLTVVYFASIMIGGRTTTTAAAAAAFVVGVGIASASWQLVLATSGALAGRVIVDRGRVATALVGYGIVLVFAARQFQQIG
jgi:threonine/homoserine/homoserine lactone efflux protein